MFSYAVTTAEISFSNALPKLSLPAIIPSRSSVSPNFSSFLSVQSIMKKRPWPGRKLPKLGHPLPESSICNHHRIVRAGNRCIGMRFTWIGTKGPLSKVEAEPSPALGGLDHPVHNEGPR